MLSGRDVDEQSRTVSEVVLLRMNGLAGGAGRCVALTDVRSTPRHSIAHTYAHTGQQHGSRDLTQESRSKEGTTHA